MTAIRAIEDWALQAYVDGELDTPDREELLAATRSIEQMASFIGADTLAYISIDGLYRAMGHPGRDNKRPQFCDACFTGDYPTALTDQEGGMVAGQLSLLAQPA